MGGATVGELRAWVQQHFPDVRWSGDEGAIRCPFHDDQTASCSVNVEKAVFLCQACGEKGRLGRLADRIGAKPPGDAPAPRRSGGLGPPQGVYKYHDETGAHRYDIVRFKPEDGGKTFRPGVRRVPEPRKWDDWDWGIQKKKIPHYPYRLPQLLEAMARGEPVFIVEGEKDVDTLAKLKVAATCNHGGAPDKWREHHAKWIAEGTTVHLIPDHDVPGIKHMHQVARTLLDRGCVVLGISLGYDITADHGKDVSDWIQADFRVRKHFDELVATASKPWRPEPAPQKDSRQPDRPPPPEGPHDDEEEGEPKKKSQVTKLIELAQEAEFFHTSDGEAYATVQVNDHQETHRIRSAGFREWLGFRFYREHDAGVGMSSLQDAVNTLSQQAKHEGEQLEVELRVAGADGAVWIDLGDEAWRAVKVTGDGWEVVDRPPVRFRRSRGTLPFPVPERGGSVLPLRSMMNLPDDDAFILVVSYMVMCFCPHGDYPILGLQGEQGSGKSVASRMIRKLVDPNKAELRSPPKEIKDVPPAVQGSWLMVWDNLSSIPQWMSDAMCAIATKAGFGGRELYTDFDEALVEAWRPQLFNGIANVATRSDLLDRSIIVSLPSLRGNQRGRKMDVMAELEGMRPKLFGALLDAVSAAVKHEPTTSLAELPRMADFAVWSAAATEGLPWSVADFEQAYYGRRREAQELALEAEPIVPYLQELMEQHMTWTGTSTELLAVLTDLAPEAVRKRRSWPGSNVHLSRVLSVINPNLKQVGITVGARKTHGKRIIVLTRSEEDVAGGGSR